MAVRKMVDIKANAVLFSILITTTFLLSQQQLVAAQNLTHLLLRPFSINQQHHRETNASDPITYSRLRNEQYYLPTWRRFQLQNPHEEQRVEVSINHTEFQKPVLYTYYMNPLIDRSKITEDDLIFEALHQLYLSRFTQYYIQRFNNSQDRYLAADPQKTDSQHCSRDFSHLMSKLNPKTREGGIDFELATLFDSIATEETGLMVGNSYWLGNWEQCTERHIVDKHSDGLPVDFNGRFCVASIQSSNWAERIEANARVLRETYYYYPHHESHYRESFRIQMGLCIPETCDSSLLERKPEDLKTLVTFKLRDYFRNYSLTDLYCLPDEGSPLRKFDFSAQLFIFFTVFWLAAILIATIMDLQDIAELSEIRKNPRAAHKSNIQKLILSLSIIESYRTFITVRPIKRHLVNRSTVETNVSSLETPLNGGATSGGAAIECEEKIVKVTLSSNAKHSNSAASSDDLRFLDAIKAFIMPFIIFGHVGLVILMMCRHPMHLWNMWMPLIHLQISSTMYVDWYYCFTALITTYLMFSSKMVQKSNPVAWMYLIFHRYWRLAPCYILAFWFGRSMFKHIGSGPLWDYGTSSMGLRAVCERESWWVPITLTQNFHPLHEECILPAWYIAGDFQFFLITPFLLVLLSKSVLFGYLVPICLMSSSMAARFYQFLYYPRVKSFDMVRSTPDISMRTNWDMHFVYLRPYYRITSWLVGILVGHYCYMVRSGQWSSPLTRSSGKRTLSILAWTAFVMAIGQNFISFLADLSVPRSLEMHIKAVTAAAYSFHDLTAALISALLAAVILFGHWPTARILMEHPIWTYLSRINYFVFLYQVEVMVWLFQTGERFPDSSGTEMARVLLCTMFILYSLSLLATLLLSNPLARLETEFIGVYMRRAKKEEQSQLETTRETQLEQIRQSDSVDESGAIRETADQTPLQSSGKPSSE